MAAILLVCSNASTPATGTQALETLFEAAPFSHTVTLRSDEDGEQGDEGDFDMIMIDESCSSSTVGTDYKDIAVPKFITEPGIWDDHNLASGSSSANGDSVQVDNDGHPLCDTPNDLGADDTTVTMATGDSQINYSSDSQVHTTWTEFLYRAANTNNAGFAYDDGDALLSSDTASADIVALGWDDGMMATLTTVGENVLENAVTWLLRNLSVATVYPPFPRRQNTLVRM